MEIMRTFHDEPMAGHFGINKTFKLIHRNFWWPVVKTENGKCNAILVVVDRLTKQAHFIAVDMATSRTKLAEIFIKEIWRLHGTPKTIISDRDPRFVSSFWKDFHKYLGTKITPSTTMHPQTDGQSEKTIDTMTTWLRQYVQGNPKSWVKWLPVAEFAYNSASQESTGTTPFTMVYGENPTSPSLIEDADRGIPTGDQTAYARYAKLQRQVEKCVENIHKAQRKQQRNYNKGVRERDFEVGQRVYLSTTILPPRFFYGKIRKFLPKFVGPFTIIQRISSDAYRLEFPSDFSFARINNVINIQYLKLAHERTSEEVEGSEEYGSFENTEGFVETGEESETRT
eukprot:GHVS01104992.1.p2 GENE.GHVS01104992.1~~GHVS01104992.1.p2  ORF type:complete len:341 (+),score=13.00 GHVS01104992.1:1932-2954(+)